MHCTKCQGREPAFKTDCLLVHAQATAPVNNVFFPAGMCVHMLEWAKAATRHLLETDLLELYCGNGNFTVALAENFRSVCCNHLCMIHRHCLCILMNVSWTCLELLMCCKGLEPVLFSFGWQLTELTFHAFLARSVKLHCLSSAAKLMMLVYRICFAGRS